MTEVVVRSIGATFLIVTGIAGVVFLIVTLLTAIRGSGG